MSATAALWGCRRGRGEAGGLCGRRGPGCAWPALAAPAAAECHTQPAPRHAGVPAGRPRLTRQVRRQSPVVMSHCLQARLREAATSVRLSGLMAREVMGSESCRWPGEGRQGQRAACGRRVSGGACPAAASIAMRRTHSRQGSRHQAGADIHDLRTGVWHDASSIPGCAQPARGGRVPAPTPCLHFVATGAHQRAITGNTGCAASEKCF
jgi:hypothetical protein